MHHSVYEPAGMDGTTRASRRNQLGWTMSRITHSPPQSCYQQRGGIRPAPYFDPTNAQTSDPFQFDEHQLQYNGYNANNDNSNDTYGYPQTPTRTMAPQHSLPSAQVFSPYTLPAPPASTRPLSFSNVTPLAKTTKQQAHSKRCSNHDLPDQQIPDTASYHDRTAITMSNKEMSCAEPMVSPFFGSKKTKEFKPAVAVSSTGMPILGGIDLISVHELPDRLRSIFPFPVFNRMQSRCFKTAYTTDDNLVISAPTASGKTTVLELAICRLVTKIDIMDAKVVYIAPTKALCEERYGDWTTRFQHLGMTCSLLTGDTDGNQQGILKQSQLIITTPEKWDSITRRLQDQSQLMRLVRLLLIDEIQILNEQRGATVEAVVSRLKSTQKSIRLIALSATVPNANDVAAWLGRNNQNLNIPAHLEVFGEEYRTSVLRKFVYSIPGTTGVSDFTLDSKCDPMLPEIISQHSAGKPILIFCSTRRSAKLTAERLSEYWTSIKRLWPDPTYAPSLKDAALTKLAHTGVVYHHGAVDSEDRKAIEQAYLDRSLSVICSTSTLAVGVNLPCYLVIIKNTMFFTKESKLCEYSDLDIMQMLGRAGRPQFGNHGIGVILTKENKVKQYEGLIEGRQLLESHLDKNLLEHLNAEIALGTVRSMNDAKIWLASTFFYVRLQRNPKHYQIEGLPVDVSIEKVLEHICTMNIDILRTSGFVDPRELKSNKFGELMARQYVRFKTMITFKDMPHGAKVIDILKTLARAEEFREVKLRLGEKALYDEFSRAHGLKYPVNSCNKDERKLVLIIQAQLGGIPYPSGETFKKTYVQYRQDVNSIFSNIHRLIRCFVDTRCLIEDGMSVKHGLEISRSLAARAWDDSSLIMKQLPHVGLITVRKFQKLGIKTIEDLKGTPVHKLDKCANISLFGTKLLAEVEKFPVLRVSARVLNQTQSNEYPLLHCQAEIGFLNTRIPKKFGLRRIGIHLLIIRSDGLLVDFRHINDAENLNRMLQSFSVKLERHGQSISCYASCDEIAGTLQEATIYPNIPEHRFPPAVSVPQALSSRSFETDFDNNDMRDEDLLDAEAQEYVPIDNIVPRAVISIANRANQPVVNSSISSRESKPTTSTVILPRQAISMESIKLSNGRYSCNHTCKDKSTCRHGECCREGLEKPPQPRKKDVESTKQPKKSGKQTAAQADYHKSPLLPKKVIKPASNTKLGTICKAADSERAPANSLARLHNSVQRNTRPTNLLPNTLSGVAGTTNSHPKHQAAYSDVEDFDVAWLDEMDELDETIQSRRQTYNEPNSAIPITKEEPGPKPAIRKHRRTFISFSSDIEPDDLDTEEPRKPVETRQTLKRTNSFNDDRLAKKTRTDQLSTIHHTTGTRQETCLGPPVIATRQQSVPSVPATEIIDLDTMPTIDIDEEIAQASQDLEAFRPFKNMDGIDLDFMAQFAGCCEFIDFYFNTMSENLDPGLTDISWPNYPNYVSVC